MKRKKMGFFIVWVIECYDYDFWIDFELLKNISNSDFVWHPF
jgi:hypothetical protein